MKILSTALLCLAVSGSHSQGEGAAIAWFGTWEQGLAEAKRLDLPILLHSAAPRCGGVPGMW